VNITNISGGVIFNIKPAEGAYFIIEPKAGVKFDVYIVDVNTNVTFNVNVLGGNVNVNIENVSAEATFNVNVIGGTVNVKISDSLVDLKIYTPKRQVGRISGGPGNVCSQPV
jgi:hypothetical protein